MTTPEPSTLEPLTAAELDALDKAGPGCGLGWAHGVDCGANMPLTIFKRLIAQARAARPSPTCATCHRLDIEGNRCGHPMSPVRSLAGYDIEYFGCTLHEPSPPAQDGGTK